MRNMENIVPDPYDAPSYAGLNEQLLAAREAEKEKLEKEVFRCRLAAIINDHAPIQLIRYMSEVKCATPACNFRGTFGDHAFHVADLIVKEINR